jgi:hypothetical protein
MIKAHPICSLNASSGSASLAMEQFPIHVTSHAGKRRRRKVRRYTATAAVQYSMRTL